MGYEVVIVEKKTNLERYTEQPLNVDFFDYVESESESFSRMHKAHKEHVRSREILLKTCDDLKLNYTVFKIEDLMTEGNRRQSKLSFFRPDSPNSGFHPEKKLVISLGGDGTLLHASHFCGLSSILLGINSCPEFSTGHLCSIGAKSVKLALLKFLEGKLETQKVSRLYVSSDKNLKIPLALNDILFCNKHPAASSRYKLSLYSKKNGSLLKSQEQLSSGVWISSPAGRTASASLYGHNEFEYGSSKILVSVRELYSYRKSPKQSLKALDVFHVDDEKTKLVLFSEMRQGLICVDGHDYCSSIGFGEELEISSPKNCQLSLVKKLSDSL